MKMNNAEKIATRALGKTYALEQGFALLLHRAAQKFEDPEKFITSITDAIRDTAKDLSSESEGERLLAETIRNCASKVENAALAKEGM